MLPPRPPARLGHRIKLSATQITLLGLLILTVPVIVLTGSLVDSSMDLATDLAEGTVQVPPPPERVQEWPLVGEKLYSSWQLASENLRATGRNRIRVREIESLAANPFQQLVVFLNHPAGVNGSRFPQPAK